jgi:arginase
MSDRFIVTPFFLDRSCPELALLAEAGWSVNRPALPDADAQRRMSVLHQPIAGFVADAVAHGDRPVSIAGDCCTAIGVAAGLRRAGLTPVLIWLDAHGDFNTWETTPSGFLGGMPLAMIVGRGDQTMVKAVGLDPYPETRVILTDGRDLDPNERPALAGSAVTHLPDSRALSQHTLLDSPLWVHFDTDIVDPQDAPAMNYRAPGGPSAAELRIVLKALAQTGRIVAVSVSSWTPELDTDGRSRAVCMELVRCLIG